MNHNEIILNKDKTMTIIGPEAHTLYYKHRSEIDSLRDITFNRYWVYEVDGTLRAAQSTRANALNYMTSNNRILVSLNDN